MTDNRNFKGYELERLISKLKNHGLYPDAMKLREDGLPNYLSKEALDLIEIYKRY